jgi:hypothetical protein
LHHCRFLHFKSELQKPAMMQLPIGLFSCAFVPFVANLPL